MKMKSRIAQLEKGEIPDRIPLSLSLSSYAPKIYKISAKDFYLNPEIAFEANCKLETLFPADTGIGYTVPDALCLDFGGQVFFGDDYLSCPKTTKNPVQTLEQLYELKIPDPYLAPAASREFEYAKIRRKSGMKGGGMSLSSPFRQSVEIVGIENLLKWMRKSPESVHYLCKLVLEYSTRKAEMYLKEFGTEGWSNAFSYPMESHELISPEMFRVFSAPYALELHQRLLGMGYQKFTEHLCGTHRHNMWFWKDKLPLPNHTLVSVGEELSLEEASERLGERIILGGNLATDTLVNGTEEQVYLEAKDIIKRMKYRKGGFVLMAACVISTAVPMENIKAMIQAVEDFGYY